jgi:hypothetical protein
MIAAFRAEMAGITSLIEAAALGGDAQDTMVWCLGQLPGLYDQSCKRYEWLRAFGKKRGQTP